MEWPSQPKLLPSSHGFRDVARTRLTVQALPSAPAAEEGTADAIVLRKWKEKPKCEWRLHQNTLNRSKLKGTSAAIHACNAHGNAFSQRPS